MAKRFEETLIQFNVLKDGKPVRIVGLSSSSDTYGYEILALPDGGTVYRRNFIMMPEIKGSICFNQLLETWKQLEDKIRQYREEPDNNDLYWEIKEALK